MTTPVPFDHNDYVKLAELLNSTADILSKRFQTGKITHFRVVDLKEIVRYMRTLKKFDSNPWLKHAGTAARKTQLIQNLRNAFLYHSNPNAAGLGPAPAAPAEPPASHSSALHAAAAAHSSIHNLSSSTSAARGATYGHGTYNNTYGHPSSAAVHAPHAHSNSAAAYASSYAHTAASSSSSSSSSHGHHASAGGAPSSYYPVASSHHGASSRVGHAVPAVTAHHSGTFGNGAHAHHHHSTNTSAHAPSSSSSSHDADFIDVERLITLPEFNSGRDPFHKVERMVARKGITPNKTAGIQFNLTPDIVSRLKGATAMSRQYPASLTPDLVIHLRLFSQDSRTHHQWDRNFNVSVNSNWIKIPEPKKAVKSKKKGIEVIRALDISAHIQLNNIVEVIFLRNAFAAESFRGVAVVEVVRERETSELLNLVGKKGEVAPQVLPSTVMASQQAAHAATLPEVPSKHCGLCSSTKDLLRCSRCKSEWYCGEQHQRDHWPTHRKVCYVPTPEQEMKIREREAAVAQAQQLHAQLAAANAASSNGVKQENKDDELEVEEVDALVSLRCPLSIDRIVTPAKGRLCSHRRCFDLETFLMFSGQSGTWQCPVCYGPLPFEDIIIDTALIKILKETDEEISQVRIMPDGTFQTIAPVPEDGENDDDDDDNKKKRPRRSNDDNNNGTSASSSSSSSSAAAAAAPAAAAIIPISSSTNGSSSSAVNGNGAINNGVTARALPSVSPTSSTSGNGTNNGGTSGRVAGVPSSSPLLGGATSSAASSSSSAAIGGNQRKRKHDSPVPSIAPSSSAAAASSRAAISPAVPAAPVAGPGATADDAIVID